MEDANLRDLDVGQITPRDPVGGPEHLHQRHPDLTGGRPGRYREAAARSEPRLRSSSSSCVRRRYEALDALDENVRVVLLIEGSQLPGGGPAHASGIVAVVEDLAECSARSSGSPASKKQSSSSVK